MTANAAAGIATAFCLLGACVSFVPVFQEVESTRASTGPTGGGPSLGSGAPGTGCDHTSCPDGCCDGTTCVTSTDAACGTQGIACVPCAGATPLCSGGDCTSS